MKVSSSLPLINAVITLSVPAYAGNQPPSVTGPCPGKSQKCTRVDFNDNNGWGNGDQNAPGNSGGNNNAENGPRDTRPGNSGGNNGSGNGNNSNAASLQDQATQLELQRIESEALAKIELQNQAAKPTSTPTTPGKSAAASTGSQASNGVARRAK